MYLSMRPAHQRGFTLIELSIVLVIIGLIVGAVLVGQDLIRAAEVRATLSQIERYNTAVNTFHGKYNAIPGDMNQATAANYGFSTSGRTGTPGQGDANGLLTGAISGAGVGDATAGYLNQGNGETGMFWVDISSSIASDLIDGSFSAATFTGAPTVSGTSLVLYFPTAKLARGNMIYVFEQGGYNYYGMSNVTALTSGSMTSTLSMSPIQAYSIDTKADDGIATTGNIRATYLGGVATSGISADPDSTSFYAASAASGAYSATTCFDSATNLYVTQYQNGQGAACGLSFKFQ